jgi:putative glutamine transport system substrate-binding protein
MALPVSAREGLCRELRQSSRLARLASTPPTSRTASQRPAPLLIDRLEADGHTIFCGTGDVGKGVITSGWMVELVRAGHVVLIPDYEDHRRGRRSADPPVDCLGLETEGWNPSAPASPPTEGDGTEEGASLMPVRPLVVLFAALAVVAVACARDYHEIVSSGKLICGTKFDVRGFGFKDPRTGEVEGLDADLCREIASDNRVRPEFVEANSEDRIPLLNEGKVDIIISTMQVNDERKKEILFSHVYYVAGLSLLVRSDSDIRSVDDLNGKTVCSIEGSAYEKKKIQARAPQAGFLPLTSYPEAGRALVDGRCDGISSDERILFGLIEQFAGLELRGGTFTKERLAIGIRKGRRDLMDMVNVSLENMKANGRLVALYRMWIEPKTGEVPEVPF